MKLLPAGKALRHLGCWTLLLAAGPQQVATAQPAQLDETCFVSVLNRTARATADGVWVLPNVPANAGPVRVRATCVDGTSVRSGQSSLVTIPVRGVVLVPEISFESPVPIPERLEIRSPTETLSAAGETLQLQVVATYPGGGTADLTAVAAGTDFRSSNPAIAAVGAGGLVTARASGVVLISALNEGALAVFRLTVALSGDSDGDGLADDFELANGLDPNNAVDALDDADGDGLSTLDEFQAGLDPQNPDTDGDGLFDGREVETTGTNPLLFDTDGDGLGDGLEIETGSDPLEVTSFNLAAALSGLEVTPEAFVLIFDWLQGGASQQLAVVGRLIDGNSIDLTMPRYGTSFTSSDLAVCNFSAEPGLVFAGAPGACTVTASNGGFSDATQVTVQSFNPTVLGAIDLPPFANDVEVSGNLAFVAGGPAGLHVIDVANRTAPSLLATLALSGNANDVRVRGDLVFVAGGTAGLHVVDASNRSNPQLLATLDTTGDAIDLAVSGPFVYVADGAAGLAIVEVDAAGQPILRGSFDTPGSANGLEVAGGLAVVSNFGAATTIIDVRDPAAPVLLSSIFVGAATFDVVLIPPFAYLASADDLRVVDLANPSNPVPRGAFGADLFMTDAIAAPGGLLFTTQIRPDTPMPIFRLSNPAEPLFASSIVFSQFGLGNGDGTGLAVDGRYVYMTATRGFEAAYKPGTTGNTRLYVAQYSALEDEAGQPPGVAIAAPASGAAFVEGTSFAVEVEASDDVAVVAVDLLVDGAAVGTDFVPPYQFSVPAPRNRSSLTLAARAMDLGANVATSEPIVVTVLADQPPNVAITSPPSGASAPEASVLTVEVAASDDVAVTSVELLVDGALAATDPEPPYSLNLLVPVGPSSLVLTARAADTFGQVSTSEAVAITILPDPPPTVEITRPANGATLVESSLLTVEAEATDNRAVAWVRFRINGEEVVTDSSPPYGFDTYVPVGETSLAIEAEARDDFGRTSLDEILVFVGPDPGTTVEGRVLDDEAVPMAGAVVECLGRRGRTDASGVFSIPGVPLLEGAVHCAAELITAAGELRRALSAPRAPIPEGVTDLGDLQPEPALLYGTFDPFGTAGAVALLNPDSLEGAVLVEGGAAGGFAGLALDSSGRLFATTLEGPFGSRTSRLLELDPDSGALRVDLGPITDGAGLLSVGDLAFEPGTDALFALRTDDDGRGQAGTLYRVSPATGFASLVGATGTDGTGGLAFGPDGSLYVTRWDALAGAPLLRRLDPADGSALAEVEITSPFGEVSALAARPSDGLLLGGLRSDTGVLVIDAASGLAALGGVFQPGLFADLAFRPLPPPAGRTTVVGRVIDGIGAPVEGVVVAVRDAFRSVTGSDGRFVLSRVPASFGEVVVNVLPSWFALGGAASDLTPIVAAGTTDVGDIVIAADDPGTDVVGTVVGELGDPVPGATVKVFNDFAVLTTASAGDGTFLVTGVPSQDGLQVVASVELGGVRLRGATFADPVPGGIADAGEVVVYEDPAVPDPLTTVTGIVVDLGGFPVAGASVNVFTYWDIFQTSTSGDGRFSVSGVPTVDGDLRATAAARRGGRLLTGSSNFLTPEPAGTTDLGEILVFEEEDPVKVSHIAQEEILWAFIAPAARASGPLWCPLKPAADTLSAAEISPWNAGTLERPSPPNLDQGTAAAPAGGPASAGLSPQR